MVERRNLVKIGRLAKKADILPSKIRFYVQEELLEVVDKMPCPQKGYHFLC